MDKLFHLQLLHRLDGSVEELHLHTDYDHDLHAPLIAATKARQLEHTRSARGGQTTSSKEMPLNDNTQIP